RPDINQEEAHYRLSTDLNNQAGGQVDIYLDQYLKFDTFTDQDQLVYTFAKTIAHELGHNVGLYHTAGNGFAIDDPHARTDSMAQGEDLTGGKPFLVTTNAFKVAVGADWSPFAAEQALDYFDAYVNRPSPNQWGDGTTTTGFDGDTPPEVITGPFLQVDDA